MTPDDPRHGTNKGYNAGCHEPCCRHAHMVYRKRQRLGSTGAYVDPTGTHRRLQALAALGHTFAEIGLELGVSNGWAHSTLRHKAVHTETHSAIADLYERWSMSVPEGWVATRQRNVSRLKGWAPPLCWDNIDDPHERPKFGEKPRVHGHAATEHTFLSQLGESDDAIAAMLGIEPKSLEMALLRADRKVA